MRDNLSQVFVSCAGEAKSESAGRCAEHLPASAAKHHCLTLRSVAGGLQAVRIGRPTRQLLFVIGRGAIAQLEPTARAQVSAASGTHLLGDRDAVTLRGAAHAQRGRFRPRWIARLISETKSLLLGFTLICH
jgi:hypothetical protein